MDGWLGYALEGYKGQKESLYFSFEKIRKLIIWILNLYNFLKIKSYILIII